MSPDGGSFQGDSERGFRNAGSLHRYDHGQSQKIGRAGPTAYARSLLKYRLPRTIIRLEEFFHAGQHALHYGGTGIPEPVNGLRQPTRGMASTEYTGNRDSQASQSRESGIESAG